MRVKPHTLRRVWSGARRVEAPPLGTYDSRGRIKIVRTVLSVSLTLAISAAVPLTVLAQDPEPDSPVEEPAGAEEPSSAASLAEVSLAHALVERGDMVGRVVLDPKRSTR